MDNPCYICEDLIAKERAWWFVAMGISVYKVDPNVDIAAEHKKVVDQYNTHSCYRRIHFPWIK